VKINCYIAAWQAYSNGSALWMACRQSLYAKTKGKMPLASRLLGLAILWPATAIWLIGHFLLFGTWPHWVYCTQLYGDCMEYVPFEQKSVHMLPPILFKGERRRMGDRRKGDRRAA
jgi:hypothetical protein